jgi:small conductance mechanosensitive channel
MDTGLNGMGELAEELVPMAVDHGLSLLGAILILIIGWIFANWAAKKVRKKAGESEKFDDTLVPVFGQVVRILILIVTVLAVLGQFGIQTASIIALLGAAGLAVGLALQGTLGNIASGIMILVLRPFKAGDVVDVGGTMGVVDEIGLFVTEMRSFDNIGIIMPNSQVWGSQIMNYSRFETRRVDMEFGIGYGDDMEKAMRLIREVLDEDERILP